MLNKRKAWQMCSISYKFKLTEPYIYSILKRYNLNQYHPLSTVIILIVDAWKKEKLKNFESIDNIPHMLFERKFLETSLYDKKIIIGTRNFVKIRMSFKSNTKDRKNLLLPLYYQ